MWRETPCRVGGSGGLANDRSDAAALQDVDQLHETDQLDAGASRASRVLVFLGARRESVEFQYVMQCRSECLGEMRCQPDEQNNDTDQDRLRHASGHNSRQFARLAMHKPGCRLRDTAEALSVLARVLNYVASLMESDSRGGQQFFLLPPVKMLKVAARQSCLTKFRRFPSRGGKCLQLGQQRAQ